MARGAVIKPNRGLSVFCARFTPVGAYMALLKNGFRPWASAWDTQPLNHTDNVQSGKCRRGVAISRVDRPEWHDAKQEVPNNDGYRKCGQPAPPENSGSSLLGCHRRGDHVAAYRHDCGRWLTNDRKIRALRGPIAFSRRVSSPRGTMGLPTHGVGIGLDFPRVAISAEVPQRGSSTSSFANRLVNRHGSHMKTARTALQDTATR